MRRQLLTGATMLLVMTLALGVAYPLVVTAAAQLAFRDQANGSLIEQDGETLASSLIGQQADGEQWFHPRPSAAGDGYDATSSSGSNLGPTSPELIDDVEQLVEDYRAENGLVDEVEVPVDAVTGSGSGLDPHISVANARLQSPRVAAARGLDPAEVRALVEDATEHRPLGVLGDDGVNVVELNLALERAQRGP